jgi:hypothetical protein
MARATAEYFPNSDIMNDSEANAEALAARDEESAPHGAQLYPLHRINTGLTSLVGSQNGQRPGGYVLVIDGLALTDVGPFLFTTQFLSLIGYADGYFSRPLAMTVTRTHSSVSRCCAKLWCAVACPPNRRH